MAKLPRIGDSKVLESRETEDGTTIRRRRVSPDGYRFTTYERIELPPLTVVKRSGNREIFDRDKLITSIQRSVGKFMKSELEIEAVADKVVDLLRAENDEEVTAQQIGEAVLVVLAGRNEVAYVRYASVFMKFKTLDDFKAILQRNLARKEEEE